MIHGKKKSVCQEKIRLKDKLSEVAMVSIGNLRTDASSFQFFGKSQMYEGILPGDFAHYIVIVCS